MKFKGKYILLAVVIVLIIAGVYSYNEYNRKPADVTSLRTQSTISADSLVMSFENNEPKANELYLGKPIEVRGIIGEISNQQDTLVNISLGKNDDMHRVSCLMDINHIDDVKGYNAGDQVIIRGICIGYLMDVELNRCVVVK